MSTSQESCHLSATFKVTTNDQELRISQGRTIRSRRSSHSSSRPDLDSEDGPRILAAALAHTSVILATEGARDRCPRCSGKVFEAEKVVTAGGVYHRQCLVCQGCGRGLQEAGQGQAGPEGGLYCAQCYARTYGPVGRPASQPRMVRAKEEKVSLSSKAHQGPEHRRHVRDVELLPTRRRASAVGAACTTGALVPRCRVQEVLQEVRHLLLLLPYLGTWIWCAWAG